MRIENLPGGCARYSPSIYQWKSRYLCAQVGLFKSGPYNMSLLGATVASVFLRFQNAICLLPFLYLMYILYNKFLYFSNKNGSPPGIRTQITHFRGVYGFLTTLCYHSHSILCVVVWTISSPCLLV